MYLLSIKNLTLTPKKQTEENGKSPRIGGFRGLKHLDKQGHQNWKI
jgi:hypothetical protein